MQPLYSIYGAASVDYKHDFARGRSLGKVEAGFLQRDHQANCPEGALYVTSKSTLRELVTNRPRAGMCDSWMNSEH